MAELDKKLGTLSLAILENFVEGVLGEKFVKELYKPTGRGLAIATALEKTEELFVGTFEDKDLSKALFVDLSQKDRPVLKDAVGEYFDHPTNPNLRKSLQQILFDEFGSHLSKEQMDRAVDFYLKLLTKELMLADDVFRDNIAALAIVESNLLEQRQVELLEKIAEKIVNQQATTQQTLRSLHQLPQPPADFTGRKELIEQLLNDFNSHKGATISGLTGMGGIGKTALGLKVAHKVADMYPDAQIFLDLKGTTTPLSAVDIARHVILSFEPTADLRALDETNFQPVYQSVLHGKKALLFFDNARSADQIAPLTPPATCAMLVTSRWTFNVSGLKNRRVDVMGEDEAVMFLLELCPHIAEKALELAKTCGYLPLALRIAGSYLRVNDHLSVETYLNELIDHTKRLSALENSHQQSELGKEHPNLVAAFELSYNSLSEDNQKCWRMLGVFPAKFASTAVQTMWETDETETGKLLGLFRRYSLMEFDEISGRYSLHDLLTDYALVQLDGEEEQQARFTHASHYKEVLGAADDLYLEGGDNILLGLKLFDIEWENIQIGQAWTSQVEKREKPILQLLAQYPDAGVYVLSLRQHPRERIEWLESSVLASREIGDRRGEGAALGNLGLAYAALGDAKKAIEFYEQALIIDREIGDRRGEGADLGNLGNALYGMGKQEKGIGMMKQALEIFETIESPNAQWARNKLKEWGVEE